MRRITTVLTLSLLSCFSLLAAIPGNLELAVLQEEVNQAVLDVRDAKASRWPTIEMEASGTYMSNPLIGPITIPAGSIAPVPLTPATDLQLFDGMEPTLYEFGVSITQPLFTWGKINASVKAQEAVSEAKRQELMLREKELSTEIATRAASLQELKKIKEILEQQYLLSESLISLSEKAVQEGMSIPLEHAENELLLQEIEIAMLEITYAIAEQTGALNHLTSIQDFSDYSYDEEAILAMLATPQETLVRQSLSPKQASLAALEALEEASMAGEKMEKGSFYGKPDLALVVSAGYSGAKFPLVESDWNTQENYDFTVSIGLKSTLFDGGKIANAIRRAESKNRSATLDLQEARGLIIKEVTEQYLLLNTTMRKLELERKKQETLLKRVATNKDLYEAGYAEKKQLLTSEMDVLSSRITEHQLKIEAWEAYQNLRFLSDFQPLQYP